MEPAIHPGRQFLTQAYRALLPMSCRKLKEDPPVTQHAESFHHRRRHARIDSSIPVRISTIEPERDPRTGRPFFRTLQETCANVSRGGLFIKTAEPLDPGRRLLVEIRLPSGRPLEAIGRIAWVKRVLSPDPRDSESGIGIEFLGGASEQLRALDEYVSDRSSDSFPEPSNRS
jgi:uncharacterized protein (TIGR02266 family)